MACAQKVSVDAAARFLLANQACSTTVVLKTMPRAPATPSEMRGFELTIKKCGFFLNGCRFTVD
jgi:hypothetical protein